MSLSCRNISGTTTDINIYADDPLSELQEKLARLEKKPGENPVLAAQIKIIIDATVYPNYKFGEQDSISALWSEITTTHELQYIVTYISDSEHTFLMRMCDDRILCNQVSEILMNENDAVRDSQIAVLAAVRRNGFALKHASKRLRADREVVLAAVRENFYSLEHASIDLRADRDFLLTISHEGIAIPLGVISEELRADREIVMLAVSREGESLRYASENLRADEEVVLAAVRCSGVFAMSHVSINLLSKYSQYCMIYDIGDLDPAGKPCGIYLYRDGVPQKIHALIIHNNTLNEKLCLSDKDRWNILQTLAWPTSKTEETMQQHNNSDHLIKLIMSNCEHGLVNQKFFLKAAFKHSIKQYGPNSFLHASLITGLAAGCISLIGCAIGISSGITTGLALLGLILFLLGRNGHYPSFTTQKKLGRLYLEHFSFWAFPNRANLSQENFKRIIKPFLSPIGGVDVNTFNNDFELQPMASLSMH